MKTSYLLLLLTWVTACGEPARPSVHQATADEQALAPASCTGLHEALAQHLDTLTHQEAWLTLKDSCLFRHYGEACGQLAQCDALDGNCAPEREELSKAWACVAASDAFGTFAELPVAQNIENLTAAMQSANCFGWRKRILELPAGRLCFLSNAF